jgi:hypothetical protein
MVAKAFAETRPMRIVNIELALRIAVAPKMDFM